MSTIITSGHAAAVGGDLQIDDTISFRRLADGGYGTERCYLPWCVDHDEYSSSLDTTSGLSTHVHHGLMKELSLDHTSNSSAGEIRIIGGATVQIEQIDDELPSGDIIRGDVGLYIAFDSETMTPELAIELGELLIRQARLAIASRSAAAVVLA